MSQSDASTGLTMLGRMPLPETLDVLIVGGGPAGTAAAFRCHELGLKALVIDFDDVLKRIRDYPKDKLILPDFGGGDRMRFPDGGDCIRCLQFAPIDKDDICSTWKEHYRSFGVPVKVGLELTGIERSGDAWNAVAWDHRSRESVSLRTRHIVLALGRGVPRRFDIPGNTDGIAYRMDDPVNYVDGPVCIIGGGTSAAEAVIAISKAKIEAGEESHVFWSYRGSKMPRVSKALADEFFEAYIGNGNIRYQPNSEPVAIVSAPERVEHVSLRIDRKVGKDRPPETTHLEFPKTRCIACIGEDIPEKLLNDLGIEMVPGGSKGKKMCAVSPLLETQQPNVYLIGDLLSQAYLETDDFKAPLDRFRQVKHRGNIKTALRDGVFIAEVIRQRLDGRTQIDVVIADAEPQEPGVRDTGVAKITAALGLSPETEAVVADTAAGDEVPGQGAWLVSMTPTGVEAEQYTLTSNGTTTIGRTGCDITFPNDMALSENHASLSLRNGNWYLRDLGSRGGTYLRIRPDNPVAVIPGALLRAGRQILVVGQDTQGFYIDQFDTAGHAVGRHRLEAKQVVFGRRAGPSHPDIALDDHDMTLSRFHLSASVQGAVIVIHDFGSRNGTYLKIDGEHWLDHNDTFRVGNQLFELRLHEDLPEKTGSAPVAAPEPVAAAPQPAAPSAPAGTQPHITFADQNISGEADPGETLLEWADARDVEIDNECWIGMCGCDMIRIVEGQEFLNEVAEKELKTLKRKGLEPGPYRLACMARCSGPVVVEVVAE